MKGEIYAIKNPSWLADTFIFCEYEDKDIETVFIKLNNDNQIEEIGTHIMRRMHLYDVSFTELVSSKRCRKATDEEIAIFKCIGDEYWYHCERVEKALAG